MVQRGKDFFYSCEIKGKTLGRRMDKVPAAERDLKPVVPGIYDILKADHPFKARQLAAGDYGQSYFCLTRKCSQDPSPCRGKASQGRMACDGSKGPVIVQKK